MDEGSQTGLADQEAHWLEVSEASDAGHARRSVTAWAREAGVPADRIDRAEVVVAELAGNLTKYGRGRRGLWFALQGDGADPAISIVSVDGGPGIGDVATALEDGVSQEGSLGIGLGSVQRLSDGFGIHSVTSGSVGRGDPGTVVASVVGPVRSGAFALMRRLPGERVCGDAYYVGDGSRSGDRSLVAVIDGLGHGDKAAQSAHACQEVFAGVGADTEVLAGVFAELDRALRGMRGAAVSVVRCTAGRVEWAGVGNVAARSLPTPSRHLVPSLGTLGLVAQAPRVETVAASHGGWVVLASDGIADRWRSEEHGALALRHPLVLAAVLMRDFARPHDDATVVVAATM